jgi:starch phosphorylase
MDNLAANGARVAYFSMEIALGEAMPTYAGGLGVLAGDTLRAAADLKVPMVGVSLLHRKGYFHQRLDASGWQHEEPEDWRPEQFLTELPQRVTVEVERRPVLVRAWQYDVRGASGHVVPVLLLDASLPENSEWDRTLTDSLYGGDAHYRLCQEVILGIGGVRMLRALGYAELSRFHMNEGHASLLAVELLDEHVQKAGRTETTVEEIATVRQQCVFTTHTPVPAGHDQYPLDMVDRVLGKSLDPCTTEICRHDGHLNLTYVALTLSHYINGVAKRHGEVSRHMFAGYAIESITNGVHPTTWVAEPMQRVFDRYIPGWREDPSSLRYALNIPQHEFLGAHDAAKRQLLDYVKRESGATMEPDVLTIGFARRSTAYKRPQLLFRRLDELRRIARDRGRLQIIYSGKAHPHDGRGKELIQQVHRAAGELTPDIKVVYLPNYELPLAKLLVSGVDVWLNTPQPPLEASGTSGMKASLNGVPSLSVLDGWWIEGCIEGVTGWAIGALERTDAIQGDQDHDASSLYQKLNDVVVPLYYGNRAAFAEVMRHAIALNGSFFNTHRMIQQYVLKAYFC